MWLTFWGAIGEDVPHIFAGFFCLDDLEFWSLELEGFALL